MNEKSLLQLVEIEKLLLESGGELTPDLEAALFVPSSSLPDKIDSYDLTIDRFESNAKFYKERAEFFSNLAKQFIAAADRLKENVKLAMAELGTDELVGFDIRFKLQDTKPAVVVEDESKIDGAYTTVEQVVKINKDRILQDLKLGVPVVGVRLEPRKSLRVYANSPAAQRKAKKA